MLICHKRNVTAGNLKSFLFNLVRSEAALHVQVFYDETHRTVDLQFTMHAHYITCTCGPMQTAEDVLLCKSCLNYRPTPV